MTEAGDHRPMRPDRPGTPPPFRLGFDPHRATIVVTAHGEIDIATAAEVSGRLREVMEAGFQRVVLDLREVSFIDSSGLRAVIEARAASQETEVEFALVPGPEAVQRLFEVTGTKAILNFIDATAIDR